MYEFVYVSQLKDFSSLKETRRCGRYPRLVLSELHAKERKPLFSVSVMSDSIVPDVNHAFINHQ